MTLKKILVVDDNLMNRRLITDILRCFGYELMAAENGEDGLKMAREQQPDLILLDLQMPVQDGFATLQLLRKDPETKSIKVIAVTSYAMAGDKGKILAAGFDEYISKPLNTRDLPVIVKKMLGGPHCSSNDE